MTSHQEPQEEIILAQTVYPRRHDLDALRAFAMLLGIALHAGLSFLPFPWPVQDTQQNELFGLFFSAIHGFRMPLFFLLSGFFTAMLWRRRGLKSLLWHRFRRVFLPLLLGTFTIAPAVTVISIIAIVSGQGNRSESSDHALPTIVEAAKKGDVIAIEQHLAGGADLNSKDPTGMSPLAWAAQNGHVEAVELLIAEGADIDATYTDGAGLLHLATISGHPETTRILLENGADPNARHNDGSTPLHWATILGRAEIAELLIQNGADPNAANHRGDTAQAMLAINWGLTKFIAGLMSAEVQEDEVTGGRARIAELLQRHSEESGNVSATESGQGNTKSDRKGAPDPQAIAAWLTDIPIFHHLWFLWFLCWLVAAFAVYAKIADWLKWRGPPKWLIVSPARWLWLIPLTMIPQASMGLTTPVFGPDLSAGLLPIPHVLLYYALFFGFGALYFDCDDEDGRLGRRWWLTLPVALLIVFPLGLELSMGVLGWRNQLIPPEWHRPLGGVLQVIYAWTMTFALMGAFHAVMKRESKAARYVSDSSYWLYVAHLPLVIGVQLIVRAWPLPASVKFALVCIVITAFLLLTYHTMVRYTWLGRLLNGPRKRPERVKEAVVAETA